MQFLHTNNAPAAIGPYPQAIRIKDMIFTSGQIALKPDGTMIPNDIKAQTRQVLANIKAILEDNESSLDNVVKVTIYLADMKDFGVVNVLYAEAFGEHKPARSTVAVKTLPKDALIEMDVIALVNDYH